LEKTVVVYIIKEFVHQKRATTGNFLSVKREGGGEIERGGWAGQQAVIL
jgi:hypothetical protein